jgi:hypothetical protein
LIPLIAALQSVIHTGGYMISKYQFLYPNECRSHREKLGYDVDTVTFLLDHTNNTAELADNAPKPAEDGRFIVRHHWAISGVLMMVLARRRGTGLRKVSNFLSRNFGERC